MKPASLTDNRKTRRPMWAWIAATLPFLAGGCGHSETKVEESAATPTVTTVHPKRETLTRLIEQPGYLRAYEQTPIYTKIAGFAETVDVDIGDPIKKGQLLLKLWVPEVVQDLKVKEERVRQAEADLKQSQQAALAAKASREAARAKIQEMAAGIARAEADVKRWQAEEVRGSKLVGKGVYDQQTLDEVQNQLRSSLAIRDEAKAKYASSQASFDEASARYGKAEADVDVADARLGVTRSEYSQWKAWLDYAELRAPYDGIVTLRNVHTGHFLQPANSGSTSKAADPLFMVMRTDKMRVTVQVPEKDAVLVKDGDEAIVHLQAVRGTALEHGRDIDGKVTRFSWSLDERARTLRLEVHLKNLEGVLRPGMYANVTIVAKVPNALTLPAAAILNDILANGDRSYCFVVENGTARKTFIETGVHGQDGLVEVLRKQVPGGKWQDFTGSEQVVVSNPGALMDDQAVQLKNGN